MSSTSADVLGALSLVLYAKIVLAGPFYFPSDGYQVDQYYYNVPAKSDFEAQPASNGYNYYQPTNSIVPTPAQTPNVGAYNDRVNYYGEPGYSDYRTRLDNRYIWNDPYTRQQWNNYYQRYYYPSASGWDDRRDGAAHYSKRRQDSVPSPETVAPASTPPPLRPSVPRKKKLFVPNVWG